VQYGVWAISSFKKRYLQYKKAGNQCLGRVICGLRVNDVLFAVSPPSFDFKPGNETVESDCLFPYKGIHGSW
jgi:hypothetical protein